MTALTRTPQNTNYLQPTKFLVTFDRIPTVQYFCQVANIPGVSLGQAPLNYSGADIYAPGNKLTYNQLTLTFTIDEKLIGWQELYNWLRAIASPEGTEVRNRLRELQSTRNSYYSDGILTVMSALNNPIINIHYINLFPISLSDITFDAKASADEIITADATFVYDYFNFEPA